MLSLRIPVRSLPPFYRWRDWDPSQLSNFPRVSPPVSGGVKIESQVAEFVTRALSTAPQGSLGRQEGSIAYWRSLMCLRKRAAWPVGLSRSQERTQPALQRSKEAGDLCSGSILDLLQGFLRTSWNLLNYNNFSQSCLGPEKTHFLSPAHNSRLQHNTSVWALCVHLLSVPARTAPRLTTVAECTFIKTLPSFFKWFGRELEVYTFRRQPPKFLHL